MNHAYNTLYIELADSATARGYGNHRLVISILMGSRVLTQWKKCKHLTKGRQVLSESCPLFVQLFAFVFYKYA